MPVNWPCMYSRFGSFPVSLIENNDNIISSSLSISYSTLAQIRRNALYLLYCEQICVSTVLDGDGSTEQKLYPYSHTSKIQNSISQHETFMNGKKEPVTTKTMRLKLPCVYLAVPVWSWEKEHYIHRFIEYKENKINPIYSDATSVCCCSAVCVWHFIQFLSKVERGGLPEETTAVPGGIVDFYIFYEINSI